MAEIDLAFMARRGELILSELRAARDERSVILAQPSAAREERLKPRLEAAEARLKAVEERPEPAMPGFPGEWDAPSAPGTGRVQAPQR